MKKGMSSLLNYQKYPIKFRMIPRLHSKFIRPNTYHLPTTNQGFTIVEMMIIAPIVILVIGIFITAIVNMTGDTLATRSANALSYNIQDALNRIEQDVKISGSFLATNNINITAPQGYDDISSGFNNVSATNGTMLILNSYATNKNPLDPTQKKVYIGDNPIMINIVYFVKNGTLWKRVLTPSNYTASDGTTPWQQPSCAIGITGAQCKTQDTRLVDGIVNNSDFSISYYPNSTSTTANAIASDSSQSTSNRQTALIASGAITININATSSIAGRSITRSGTIRTVSPSNNISTTTAAQAPVILTHPSNKTDLASDTNITFTATAQGATPMTVKWQQSPDQGATWTDIAGATTTTLTIPSVTNTMDGYRYKAIFTNSQGSVTSSNALLTVNLLSWSAFSLQNSWVNFNNAYNGNGYRKTTDGVVVLKGLISKAGTPAVQEVIGILPVSYRPSSILIFMTGSIDSPSRIDVYPNGEVRFIKGSGGWLSLEGIHFMPDNGRYSRTNISAFQNGWVNYLPNCAPASYLVDNSGRVHVQGLIGPGTSWADNTVTFNFSTNLAPQGYMHIAAASETMSAIGISLNPAIVTKGIGNSWLSINTMYYPATYKNWTDLALQNSWVTYPGFTTPQYTKSPDGIVTLKGLLSSGVVASGTVIAQLPAGYRPSATVLATTISALAYSRIDITAAGEILSRTTSNTWLSFDGVSFYADQ